MNIPTYAVDFESFYSNDCTTKKLGPIGYFSHPDFDAYLVTVVGDNGFSYVGHPKDFDWLLLNGARVLSHNAAFDETLYKFGVAQGWWSACLPAEWHCTADMAAYCGLPRALKGAAAEKFGIIMSKDTRDDMKNKRWQDMSPDFQEEVKAYALKDSEICLQLWQACCDEWPEPERRISEVNRRICQRGLPIDESLLTRNIEVLAQQLFDAEEAIPWRESGALLSPKLANAACRAAGVQPPASWALNNEDTEEWLDKYSEQFPWVMAVRNYRRINMLLKKFKAFEAGMGSDGRFYGGIMYYGAHTGRFSASGGNLNLQNMPRKDMFGVSMREVIRCTEGKTFVIADLAQIEVRTLCWLAGDKETLAEIAKTDDIYEAFAIRFGLWSADKGSLRENDPATRHMVKSICLGAGYGASPKKFAMITKMDLREAEKCITLFRTKMKKVVDLWGSLDRKLKLAARSQRLEIPLPSGNAMIYKGIRRTADELVCERQVFGKKVLVRPWHGSVVENISQKLARDIFCDALLRIDESGLDIVLHVHDEVVIECGIDEAQNVADTALKILRTPPAWIPDIPLDAEATISQVYTK